MATIELFPSAVRGAGGPFFSPTIINRGYSGGLLHFDVTIIGAGTVLFPIVELLNEITGVWALYDLTSNAFNAAVRKIFTIGPGQSMDPTGVLAINEWSLPLGPWRMNITHNNTNDTTYSCGFVPYKQGEP